MLNPKDVLNGQEQFENYYSDMLHKNVTQYDYRDIDGELFSCVKPTVEDCRQARDKWLKKRGA